MKRGIEIEKMEFFIILKQAFMIPFKNPKFIPFSFLASIPLLCFIIFHEMILQSALIIAFEILKQPQTYFSHWLIRATRKMANEFSFKMIQLSLLHLLPLQLFELCAAVVTVDLTAKTYTKQKQHSQKNMVSRLVNKASCKGILITSSYVCFISTCFLMGSTWLVTNYYIMMKTFFYNMFTAAVFRVACMALLVKYLEWTAIWNMSIVISILEGIHGADALGLSAYFCRGRERQSFLLMLVFFIWGVGLRLACFHGGCSIEKSWRFIIQVSLICMGTVMKWVVCVIFFCRRKEQNEQRVDDEEAGEQEQVKALDI